MSWRLPSDSLQWAVTRPREKPPSATRDHAYDKATAPSAHTRDSEVRYEPTTSARDMLAMVRPS